MIDVIIPVYNVDNNTLFKCLSSIACQSISNELKIILIDDASPIGEYEEVIKHFKSILDIKLIKNKKNIGCGPSRQVGLDNSNNEYITFIDADDTLNGAFALEILKHALENNNGDVCVGVFDEIHSFLKDDVYYTSHEYDMTWMLGKLYRRELIEKFNIKFHPTARSNEDGSFNTLIRLCTNKIYYIPAHVYYWHDNPNSVTNQKNYDSFNSYIENAFYVLEIATSMNKNVNDLIDYYKNYINNYYINHKNEFPKIFEKFDFYKKI